MAADELLALYDPADDAGRVTGSARRDEVRAQNLPHAATAVLVRNSRGQVYLHRRTDTKDVYPGLYDVWAGGCVDAGEEPARRRPPRAGRGAGRHRRAAGPGVPRLVPRRQHPLPRLRLRGGLGRTGRAPARGGRRGRLGRLGGAAAPARGPGRGRSCRTGGPAWRTTSARGRHERRTQRAGRPPDSGASRAAAVAFVVDIALVVLFARSAGAATPRAAPCWASC